jgi:hypothetical protein
LTFVIIGHERGIPSKCGSSARADYVPALCTHRPSLLPIGWLSEVFGLRGNCSNVNALREIDQTWSSRGSKSRNKVSVAQSIVLEHYRDDNAPSAVTLAEALAARKGALCDCK